MADDDPDPEQRRGEESVLKTQIPGIEVTTKLVDEDPDDLEAVHQRQLEWALEHAEEATESTRL